jgi:hypothetical protein
VSGAGVVQRPAVDANVHEGAPIVLTTMASTSALRFPQARDGHYVVYGVGSRAIIGELWSSPDRSVALAVTPGRYIIHRRAGGGSAALQIDIGPGEQREVRSADFRTVPEEVLVKKGGEIILHPNELSLGYTASTAHLYDLGHRLALGYRHGWESIAIGIGALVGTGARDAAGQVSTFRWIGTDAIVEARGHLGPLLLHAGGGLACSPSSRPSSATTPSDSASAATKPTGRFAASRPEPTFARASEFRSSRASGAISTSRVTSSRFASPSRRSAPGAPGSGSGRASRSERDDPEADASRSSGPSVRAMSAWKHDTKK